MIEVKNLVKKYGDHFAVNGLSFSLENGKIYGFLGPNGAGKSTTMNMMTGYIASTSGDVVINGHSILDEPEEAKKCIGYLPEIPPVYPEMTVSEYLTVVADLKRIPKVDRKSVVADAMETVKITEMKDRLIKNLSKGYKQRVGIAQALIGEPDIIILDEPTVGLDPHQIIEIRELVRSLGQKHTVIISSHILTEISEVCDYVLIINHGKLVAADSTENLEEMFAGGNSLELLVDGKKDAIVRTLSSFGEIIKCDIADYDEEQKAYPVQLKVTNDADIRRGLFKAFASADMPIIEMKSRMVSLEEVFLELTRDIDVDKENDTDIDSATPGVESEEA